MSFCVHINIVWETIRNRNRVIEIADTCLKLIPIVDNERDISWASEHMLESIIEGKCFFDGQKGGLVMFGGIFNYTSASTMIDELLPFFIELYKEKLILYSDSIMCFQQDEQSPKVYIYQINLKNKWFEIDNEKPELDVKDFSTKEWYWTDNN